MKFFAYGTLMIPNVMHAVTGRSFTAKEARLRDYARFRIKDAVYPGIVQAPRAVTFGMVYFDLDCLALKRLDGFEGSLYRRIKVCVETKSGEFIDAETYVVKPACNHRMTSTPWDLEEFERKYLDEFFTRSRGFRSVRAYCDRTRA